MAIVDRLPFRYLRQGPFFRPMVSIRLNCKGETLPTTGLLDSGSDCTIIPKEIADAIGIEPGKRDGFITGVGGHEDKTKWGQVTIALLSEDGNDMIPVGNVTVMILEKSETEPPKTVEEISRKEKEDLIILGRDPFFKLFNITFSPEQDRIIMRKVRLRRR